MVEPVRRLEIGSFIQGLADRGVYNVRIGRSTDQQFLMVEWTEPKATDTTEPPNEVAADTGRIAPSYPLRRINNE